MINSEDNTPVIVGLGFEMNRADQARDCPEPLELMLLAIKDAVKDCGNSEAGSQLESIAVQQGMWEYSNPAAYLASELNCERALTELSDLGILQLTPFFELCNRISLGQQNIGVHVGGEAKYRELRARINGEEVSNSSLPHDTPAPDTHYRSEDPFASDVEAAAQIFMPVDMFAVIESALRKRSGLGVEEHRDHLADMYAGFSKIAASNEHAWHREPLQAGSIRNAEGKNSMLAFPYTKKHNTQWNVNQAVAIIVCSVAKARQLGIDERQWVYPLSAARSNHVVCLAQQASLCSHEGTRRIGEQAFSLAQLSPADVDMAELYSCFPAAVQSFALDFDLPESCPLSVSGSMAFAGGPYNHSALDGVARMTEVLREQQQHNVGLVSNLSGVFGKTGVILLSNVPGKSPYGFCDVSAQVAAVDHPLTTNLQYQGEAEIIGYTVSFHKDQPIRALMYCDLPNHQRTVVQSTDVELMQSMMEEEWVGRGIRINPDHTVSRLS
ncbi:MAG: hypothetical protein AAF542_16160 [Pseudomonadota bacterium]